MQEQESRSLIFELKILLGIKCNLSCSRILRTENVQWKEEPNGVSKHFELLHCVIDTKRILETSPWLSHDKTYVFVIKNTTNHNNRKSKTMPRTVS